MLEIDESLQQTEPDCREGSESKPFLLRHPARADLDVLVALANTPAMTKNLCSNWLPVSAKGADSWFLNQTEKTDPTEFPFIITDMKGSMIGVICLLLEENRKQAEISVDDQSRPMAARLCHTSHSGCGRLCIFEPEHQSTNPRSADRAVQGFVRQLSTHCREMRFSI